MTLKCKNPYFDENIDRKFVFLLFSVLIVKGINLGEKFDGLFISDDKVGILETHLDYEMAVLKEVSVYEAFEHCIPDGMKYNKELDKLVPDVIEKQWTRENTGSNHFASDGTAFNTIEEALSHNYSLYFDSLWCKDVEMNKNEYCSGIKVEFEKLADYTEEKINQRENGFIKADLDKIDFTLVEPYAYQDLAKQLTIGAKKYSKDNWKKGDILSYLAALERHINHIQIALEENDLKKLIDDTGVNQGGALMFNSMAIHYFIRQILKDGQNNVK